MSDLIEYLNKFGLATRNYSNVRILVVAQNANQERILHFSTSPGIEIQSLGERAILRIKKSFFLNSSFQTSEFPRGNQELWNDALPKMSWKMCEKSR